jgi:hypothetical protein
MLDSHELRQIGQRISLRYRITPLSFRDTQDYIQYRLNVASQKGARIFDTAACRRIFAHSKGIPRVINIACDRALLAAFSLNHVALALAIFTLAAGLSVAGHWFTIALGNVVIIVLEGGVVQHVACDRPARVLSLDRDTEGADDDELTHIADGPLWASMWAVPAFDEWDGRAWADGEKNARNHDKED